MNEIDYTIQIEQLIEINNQMASHLNILMVIVLFFLFVFVIKAVYYLFNNIFLGGL